MYGCGVYAAVKPRSICLYAANLLSEFSTKTRSWRSALGALPGLPRTCKAASAAGVRGSLGYPHLGVPSDIAQNNGLSDAVRVTFRCASGRNRQQSGQKRFDWSCGVVALLCVLQPSRYRFLPIAAVTGASGTLWRGRYLVWVLP